MQQTNTSKVAIVIVNWNGEDLLLKCFKSLASQTFKNFYVIIVDNGSTDDSKRVYDDFSSVIEIFVIKNGSNIGFAAANNQGIIFALKDKPEYIVLLNNDTEADKSWLKELVRYMDHNKNCGLAQGKNLTIIDGKTVYDSTGIYLEAGLIPRQKDFLKNTTSKIVTIGPNGAAEIIRTSLIVDLMYKNCFFDSSFFAYAEDVDVLLRAIHRGWEHGYCEKAVLIHSGSHTGKRLPNKKMYWGARNTIRYIVKNIPISLLRNNFKIIAKSQIANLLFLIKESKVLFISYLAGLSVGIIQLPFYLKKRHYILKTSKIDADTLNNYLVPSNPPLINPFRNRH